jgi:hypothetical protein
MYVALTCLNTVALVDGISCISRAHDADTDIEDVVLLNDCRSTTCLYTPGLLTLEVDLDVLYFKHSMVGMFTRIWLSFSLFFLSFLSRSSLSLFFLAHTHTHIGM